MTFAERGRTRSLAMAGGDISREQALGDDEVIRDPSALKRYLSLRFPDRFISDSFKEVAPAYPIMAPRAYLDLIREPSPQDPIYAQIAPTLNELSDRGDPDPMGESEAEAAPGLLHRFPGRVLLMTTDKCLARCRHCMRKRLWREGADVESAESAKACAAKPHGSALWETWAEYIVDHREVREVILSGGDPLALSDSTLFELIRTVKPKDRDIALRLHTRAPAVRPGRVTPALARGLSALGVSRVVAHFNHPREAAEGQARAVAALRRQGIEVLNQAVLLKGVNDRPEILALLFRRMGSLGVRPYYLHHPDPARGADHFRLGMEEGHELFERARAMVEPELVPAYVVDIPGPRGKVLVESILFSRVSMKNLPDS